MSQGLLPGEALRKAAEKQLASEKAWLPPPVDLDNLKLIHELQVHQIELEMQNELLAETFAQVDALRAKYQDLYEFAPVGYFTLSNTGTILELNRRAAELLGLEAGELVGQQLREFFGPASLAELELFLQTANQSSAEVSAPALMLRARLKLPIYVNAQARAYADHASGQQRVRLTLIDVSALKMATDDVVQVIGKVSGFGAL
jgi:PAS domain S-box-containing protein